MVVVASEAGGMVRIVVEDGIIPIQPQNRKAPISETLILRIAPISQTLIPKTNSSQAAGGLDLGSRQKGCLGVRGRAARQVVPWWPNSGG